MLGKVLAKSRQDIYDAMLSISTKKTYDLTQSLREPSGTASGLPNQTPSAFKKRPMKLVYDKNEFHAFRLPSENHFLLSGFDQEDLFGRRKGIEHSPHIRAQLNLDSNLVFIYFILTFIALGLEFKYHDEYVALRDNFVNHDMGKFTYEDFK